MSFKHNPQTVLLIALIMLSIKLLFDYAASVDARNAIAAQDSGVIKYHNAETSESWEEFFPIFYDEKGNEIYAKK